MSKHHSLVRITQIIGAALAALGCGGSSSESFVGYQIVAAGGGSLNTVVGDAFRLSVVENLSDGSTQPLSPGATVTWSGPPTVTALPAGSSPADSILPQPGDSPTAFWVDNPEHLTPAQLAGVVYVLAAGTAAHPRSKCPPPSQPLRRPQAARPQPSRSERFPRAVLRAARPFTPPIAPHATVLRGRESAPGLNNETDHLAGDPGWTPPMLGFAARSNMDNDGVSLAATMPRWLIVNGAADKPLTTQDFSDMYAFLTTQHGEGPAQGP